MEKEYETPEVKEVAVKEDATSADCQMKAVGCYAGSSCGQVEIKE